jgi:hypothetical protein
MAEMLSPGVYVSEIDYSEYVSESSTCIIGMVGGARRGPIGVPTLVTTQAQMVSLFGKPIEGDYGVYSALAALTKASQLYYTRVVRGGIKASAGVLGTNKVLYKAKESGDTYNGLQISQSALSDEVFKVIVKSTKGEELESFDNLSLSGTSSNYVESIINGNSNYITASVQYSGTIKEMDFTLEGGSGSGSYARAGVEGKDKLTFRSKYYDSDLNGCTVVISEVDNYGYFDITVKNSDELIESWASVCLDTDSDRYIETIINSGSSRIVVTVNDDESITLEENSMSFSGGDDGVDGISVEDIIGEETSTGIYAVSNPETIDIDILTVPGWSDSKVVAAGISVCEDRGDCLYIVDPPFGLSAQDIIAWSNGTGSYVHTGFDSSYAALYWPWVKVSDSYTKKNVWLPPSGYVAAQYAYNDEVGHPWTAPAGLDRGTMSKPIGLELNPTKGERDAVYGNRNVVNPIVNFLSSGITIWGQKTMQRKPSSLDRVNVRRLMNYLKKTIELSTRYYVFEQNVESTWERWTTMVDPILSDIRTQGGIYDYKIEIQPTDNEVENNQMPASVSIKPTKTAEFIPLTFNIMPYTATFDE